VRKLFRQAHQTLYNQPSDDHGATLSEEMESRIRERETTDDEFVSSAGDVKAAIEETYEFLLQEVDQSAPLQKGYTNGFTGKYKAELQTLATPEAYDMLQRLNTAFYKRKLVLKKVRARIRNLVLEELADEMRSLLKSGKQPATKGLTATSGGTPSSARTQEKMTQKQLDEFAQKRLNEVQSLLTEEPRETHGTLSEEDDGIDIESYEEQATERNSRGEPELWEDFGEDEVTQVELGIDKEEHVGKTTEDDRLEFLRTLVTRTSRQSSGLVCYRCISDLTATQEQKDKKRSRAQLNKHLKGKVHTRREQLITAFNGIKAASGGSAPCPGCPKRSYRTAAKWLVHVESHHPEQLWDDDDEASDTSSEPGATDFEGFSDDDDMQTTNNTGLVEEDEYDEFEAGLSP
jgi:hypothetical protein